jgi:5,6-dimethylbenzimidazole synthase
MDTFQYQWEEKRMNEAYNKLLEISKQRRSIRRFKTDPVPDEHIEVILECARWAMSGANAQPWEFIVVKHQETREKIFDLYKVHREQVDVFNKQLVPELRHPVTGTLSAGQRSFKDAPVYLLVVGDPRTLLATSLVAYIVGHERHTFHMNLANVTTMIHLAAASLGLGTQQVSITPIWEGELKSLLGIPEWFTVVHVIPIGYPNYTPPPPYRRELREMVHYESYEKAKQRTDQQVVDYIVQLRKKMTPTYYVKGGTGQPEEKG